MEVKKVAVVGGGQIGNQIAQQFAWCGYDVNLREVDDNFLQKALNEIKTRIQRFFVEKGKMTQEEADRIMARLKGTTDLKEAVTGVDMVVEAVPEIMDLKKQIFKELESLTPPETILASNTSSLSITAIGSLTKRQDKIIGMHFFNPIAVMKLIEIVKGEGTSEDTLETLKEVSKKLGKETVVVKDSPGFITSRFFVALINEGVKMLEEGIASKEDIDKAIKLGLNHPIGPIEAADMGMDVSLHCLNYLREELGEQYRPSQLIKRMVQSGKIGWKTGQGFYDYRKTQ